MAAPLRLISHKLCPYVQRAVIALAEKDVTFERIDVDLADKPDWFLRGACRAGVGARRGRSGLSGAAARFSRAPPRLDFSSAGAGRAGPTASCRCRFKRGCARQVRA